MTNRSSRNRRSFDSAFDGLMPLESRRMLDGAGMQPTDPADSDSAEVILDGSPESDYENDIDETGDQDGSDADIYAFTVRPSGERPRDHVEADESGDDHDLYDFGQDRGEAINDEIEYETGDGVEIAADEPIFPVISGVPTEVEVGVDASVEPGSETTVVEDGAAPIALIPIASGIAWIGSVDQSASGSASIEGDEAPATWTDLSALPEPTIIAQA